MAVVWPLGRTDDQSSTANGMVVVTLAKRLRSAVCDKAVIDDHVRLRTKFLNSPLKTGRIPNV